MDQANRAPSATATILQLAGEITCNQAEIRRLNDLHLDVRGRFNEAQQAAEDAAIMLGGTQETAVAALAYFPCDNDDCRRAKAAALIAVLPVSTSGRALGEAWCQLALSLAHDLTRNPPPSQATV